MNQPTQPTLNSNSISLAALGFALLAGLASGMCFVQLFGGGWLGLFLGYMSPLFIYAAGFGGGRTAAVIALVGGLVAVLFQLTPIATLLFALTIALPAMVVTRVALIQHTPGVYTSLGTVLLAALTMGALLLLTIASITHLQADGLGAALVHVSEAYRTYIAEQNLNFTPEQTEQLIAMVSKSLPSIVLLSWFTIHAITAIVAYWALLESGKLLRPAFRISTLQLPAWLAGLTFVCIAAAFVLGADAALVLSALAAMNCLVFFVYGLVVTHNFLSARAAAANWSAQRHTATLIALYAAIFILQFPFLIVLLVGLIAPFTNRQPVQPNGQ